MLLALCAAATPVAGQQGGYGRPAGPDCSTGAISTIFVDNHSIFDTTDPGLDPRFDWAYVLANRLHFRTDEAVIRRELLFREGDCYDPLLAEETERLLRSLPFLSRVDVYGIPQGDGTYHVVVDTQDEWSTELGVNVRVGGGTDFRGVDAREGNLMGTGQSVRLFYQERRIAPEWGGSFFTPQLAGTRWDLRLEGGRTRAGTSAGADVVYPFVGEVGRWFAAERFHRRDEYFDFVLPPRSGKPETHVLLPVRNEALDLAVASRIGPPGNLTLLGGGFSFRDVGYPGGTGAVQLEQGASTGPVQPGDSALVAPVWSRIREVQDIRAFILFGQRNIWWAKRRGLDSPRGVEDVRLGAEAQLSLGRSLPAIENEDDLFGTLSLYTGMELGPILTLTRIRAEGRRNLDAAYGDSEWEDLYVQSEALSYWKPTGPEGHHTLFGRAALLGGWHTRTPFQLTLGGDGGVRGYDDSQFPGARRLNLTLEDRVLFGWPFQDVLDLGGTIFVDAGKMWAGDVPFGADSGWRASFGAGLRGAFPPGSRTTYRLDIALPADAPSLRRARFLLSIGEFFGFTVPFTDPQLARSRADAVFADVFPVGRR